MLPTRWPVALAAVTLPLPDGEPTIPLRAIFLATALLLTALPRPTLAQDCAPAIALPTYEAAAPPDGRRYDAVTLPTPSGPVTVAGTTCLQHYAVIAGTDPGSDFEIHTAYRDSLIAAGAELLATEDRLTVARLRRDGAETWVRVTNQDGAIDVTVVARAPLPQRLTAPGANDHPLLGHMPHYVSDPPDRRAFDQRGFPIKEGEETREIIVQGTRTEIDYTLREGGRLASDAEIHETYRDALRAVGATILLADARNTTARLDPPHAARPIWFKLWSQETAITLTVIEQDEHRQTLLPRTAADHRLLGGMPDYIATAPEKYSLDELVFPVQDGEDSRDVEIQGARTELTYAPRPGAMPASDLDIQTNYRNALAALGAQLLYTDSATTVARLSDNDRLLWIKIWSQETAINLSFVEEKLFKSAVKPIPAETLRTALETRGRAGLYIAFDFNRPTLRPQAGPILAEVIRLLRDNPALRLGIESHTDNIGPRVRNLSLAASRAQSVCATLAAAGIDAARLTPIGIGPDRPLADNTTSEGRARNRRVVLVRR